MIRGFVDSYKTVASESSSNKLGNLPIPFNIPNVLYNLLFEDIGIEFNQKQKDLLEALRFSYKALQKMTNNFIQQESQLQQKILHEPENEAYKEELESLRLEMFQAEYDFRELVTVVSEHLEKEQYQKLLQYSNIPV